MNHSKEQPFSTTAKAVVLFLLFASYVLLRERDTFASEKETGIMRRMMDRSSGRIMLGVLVALVCYLGLSALLAFLLTQGTVEEGRTLLCLWACALLSSFAGSKAAALRWTDRVPAFGSALAFLTVTVLGGFLVNNTLDPTRTVQTAAAVAIGGTLSALTTTGFAKKKRTGRKRY